MTLPAPIEDCKSPTLYILLEGDSPTADRWYTWVFRSSAALETHLTKLTDDGPTLIQAKIVGVHKIHILPREFTAEVIVLGTPIEDPHSPD